MRVGIYPGTFDPITKGHMDIIKRSFKLFDRLIVAVALSEKKTPLFDIDERVMMVRELFGDNPNITVESYDGLLVDFARQKNVEAVIRGMRAISDFEYEMQIALTNRKLDEEFETIYLMPSLEYVYLNSSVVRELASMGAELHNFVTPNVEKHLRRRFDKSGT